MNFNKIKNQAVKDKQGNTGLKPASVLGISPVAGLQTLRK